MTMFVRKSFLISGIASLLFAGSFALEALGEEKKGISHSNTLAPVISLVMEGENVYPEDVTVNGGRMYVSSIADGSVREIELLTRQEKMLIPPAKNQFNSAWGIKVHPKTGQLIVVMNQKYNFKPENAKAGRIQSYNLKTGKLEKSWEMPESFVGNAVDFDHNGNIYVGDIGPKTRIIKIEPIKDKVSVWAQDQQWNQNGFGMGGMVFNKKDGFYAAHKGKLWFIKMNADGTAAPAEEVEIAGLINVKGQSSVASDGMVWADDNTLYYAENDAMVPGANGILHKIVLSDETHGDNTNIVLGLKDPSGVYFYNDRIFVAESQLGHMFKTDEGKPTLPFAVTVY